MNSECNLGIHQLDLINFVGHGYSMKPRVFGVNAKMASEEAIRRHADAVVLYMSFSGVKQQKSPLTEY